MFVRTGDGERAVGSYPGATPDEALAYFARKYDELLAQVDLLDQRVRGTDLAPKEAAASVKRLRASVAEASAVGDLDTLLARLDALGPLIDARRAEADAARAAARAEALATKERLVAEAESLAESDRWKATGDRLRELFEAWKAAPRLDRKQDDELWARFRAARSTFDKRRRAHFAHLDAERADVATRKEKLVAEAEALATSTDWGATSARLRSLMDDWKSAGRAGREDEDRLWARFRAAQDAFFAARNAVFAERDSGYRANLAAKEALLVEAEALLPVTDLRAAKSALRSIQERWEKAGHVPRGDVERVEGRLRRVEQALRSAEDDEWRRTNPEARARAEDTVTQLRESIATLERRAASARDKGDDRAVREAEEALTARRSWLAEAERTLAEFTR
ncbi:MAG TPA: DUF349 domain-containing protein [Actinomycetes bacterium]|nr:DUF349 domain-containing protein [Actinomycetes bacterium]